MTKREIRKEAEWRHKSYMLRSLTGQLFASIIIDAMIHNEELSLMIATITMWTLVRFMWFFIINYGELWDIFNYELTHKFLGYQMTDEAKQEQESEE